MVRHLKEQRWKRKSKEDLKACCLLANNLSINFQGINMATRIILVKLMFSNAEAWISSVSNLIRTVSDHKSHYVEECNKILNHEDMEIGIPCIVIRKLHGLLTSASVEWGYGLLRKIEYIVSAATFDDFLDHAAMYHKGNKKTEASVLASAVLEDSIKKIASKHEIESRGKSLEELIDQLVKDDVLTLVKAKRIKSYASVRNHALHAEWDEFDIKDVGELIKGTRDLLENYR